MKSLLTLTLALTSTFALASEPTQVATAAQKKILCTAIEKKLEDENADAAVNMTRCKAEKVMISEKINRSQTLIVGRITFNTPNGTTRQTCSVVAQFSVGGPMVGDPETVMCM